MPNKGQNVSHYRLREYHEHFCYKLLFLAYPKEQNRENTEGYSRWKVEKKHDKFEKTGINNWSISKSYKGTETVPGRESVPYWYATTVANAPWKCSMETTRNSVMIKLGIQVIELVKSLTEWEVTVNATPRQANQRLRLVGHGALMMTCGLMSYSIVGYKLI